MMASSKPICRVDGCRKDSRYGGMCAMHYWRVRRSGTTQLLDRNHPQMAFISAAVRSETDECILWPFPLTKNGYGRLRYEGKEWRAHRLAAFLKFGPPPEVGMYAAHSPLICHNRACINPRHLRWATATENAADRVKDGTNPEGSAIGVSKLTESQVSEIKSRLKSGETCVSISEDYCVTKENISAINRGIIWRSVIGVEA